MAPKYYSEDWDICCRSIVYGSWKDGSDIYKDRTGYFIIQWNPQNSKFYKKYLKDYTPNPENIFRQKRKQTKKKRSSVRKTRKQDN